MITDASGPTVPIPAGRVDYLIATAARAPSVHNTQPWRFRADQDTIELYADQRRKLRADPLGRELLISCGAALFGLRLAIRSLGHQPIVDLLPDPARLRLLARVRLGAAAPMTSRERQLLAALPRRHTHRGPFAPGPLPAGLVAGLQHDAFAEGATLALIGQPLAYQQLAAIAAATGPRQDQDPLARADIRRWSRGPDDHARDGIPAHAFPATPSRRPGRLPQRDFDLGHGLGLLHDGGPPPAATAILLTPRDSRADWLRAGQALHRILAHAASSWVFASLHTQPLEAAATRAAIRDQLTLHGAPQILLQLGPAHSAPTTARRPPADLIEP
jgi:nitroreductase